MKQCFGYVRVSTVKQGEGVSLEAQKDAILAFAAQNNITITKWFEEKQTAAKSGRPVFSAMIKALRSHQAEGVVMHKIDRSARNIRDWVRVGELSDAGIDVHFAAESLDFRSRGGRLSADIQAVIAADYVRNLREETIKGINGRLKQGLYPFRAPIGYLDNGSGQPKTPDPVRAPLIREMFELYASGQHSLRTLQAEMDRRGLRNASGHVVSKCGIETILNNPFYCGLIRIKRTGAIYEGVHEPLIPPSLFQKVQDIKSGRSGKKVTKHNHTYRGLFRCAACNSPMTPEKQKRHVYYRCHLPECDTKCVREGLIEDAIKKVLAQVQLSDEDIAYLTAEIERWCDKRTEPKDANTHAMQLKQIEVRLDRLTDALIDRLIDKTEFNRRKQTLVLEQARVEEKVAEVTDKQADASNTRKFLELIKNLAATYIFADPAEKRQIVQLATSNRQVAGKNVCVSPANWLLEAEQSLAVLLGAPDRPTSRRPTEFKIQQLEELTKLARSPEVAEIETVFADENKPHTMKR